MILGRRVYVTVSDVVLGLLKISFRVDVLGKTVPLADAPVTPPVATEFTSRYSTIPADGAVGEVREIFVATPSHTILVVGAATNFGFGSTLTTTGKGIPVHPAPPLAPLATGVMV